MATTSPSARSIRHVLAGAGIATALAAGCGASGTSDASLGNEPAPSSTTGPGPAPTTEAGGDITEADLEDLLPAAAGVGEGYQEVPVDASTTTTRSTRRSTSSAPMRTTWRVRTIPATWRRLDPSRTPTAARSM